MRDQIKRRTGPLQNSKNMFFLIFRLQTEPSYNIERPLEAKVRIYGELKERPQSGRHDESQDNVPARLRRVQLLAEVLRPGAHFNRPLI